MIWQAEIANTKMDLEGDIFSLNDLAKMIDGVYVVPVQLEFKGDIGHAFHFRVTEGGSLLCKIFLIIEIPDGLFPVIGFRHSGHTESGYQDPSLLSVGLTTNPAFIGTWMKRED